MIDLDECIARLSNEDESERIYAVEDIGFTNRADGVAPLLALLGTERSRAVREAVFAALESIDHDLVVEGALDLLSSEDSFLRNASVDLLRSRGPKMIPWLQRAFPKLGPDERKLILDVLAAIDGPGASEIYSLALSDTDRNVVITAVESLGNASRVEFRGKVEELAATKDPMLLGACLEALAHIGNEQSLEPLRKRFSSGSETVPEFLLPSYLKLVGAFGTPADIPREGWGLASRSKHLRSRILDTLTLILRRSPAVGLPEELFVQIHNLILAVEPALQLDPIQRAQALHLLEHGADSGPSVAAPVEKETRNA